MRKIRLSWYPIIIKQPLILHCPSVRNLNRKQIPVLLYFLIRLKHKQKNHTSEKSVMEGPFFNYFCNNRYNDKALIVIKHWNFLKFLYYLLKEYVLIKNIFKKTKFQIKKFQIKNRVDKNFFGTCTFFNLRYITKFKGRLSKFKIPPIKNLLKISRLNISIFEIEYFDFRNYLLENFFISSITVNDDCVQQWFSTQFQSRGTFETLTSFFKGSK